MLYRAKLLNPKPLAHYWKLPQRWSDHFRDLMLNLPGKPAHRPKTAHRAAARVCGNVCMNICCKVKGCSSELETKAPLPSVADRKWKRTGTSHVTA